MIIGFNIMIDKSISQGRKQDNLPNLDLSSEPFVAYIIGGVFLIFGFYILYYLWRNKSKENK